ncbi:MAG TPA: cytochrome c [Bryobacteraceae bacterium]
MKLLFVPLACGLLSAASLPSSPTFYKDVAPILNAHCVQCHRPGEIAPMSLTGYDQVRPWASAIKEAVLMKAMPPWPSDAPAGHFSNDWRLTDQQVEIIRRWADASAPAGNRADAPPAQNFTDAWKLGEPSVVLTLPKPQQIAGNGQDLWKFIVFEKTFEHDTWIRGLEIRPGNREVVHHANIAIVTPVGSGPADWSKVPEDMEAPDNQGGKFDGFRITGVHVGLPSRFWFETEPGSAVLIPKGSRVRINIHYAPARKAATDLTQVALYYANGQISKEWQDLHCRLLTMKIPPNDPNYRLEGTKKVTEPITVYQVGAHMHLRGKTYRIYADLPDGSNVELLNVPRFNFNWQLMYDLSQPVHLPAGTTIHYIATYDNSPSNRLVTQYDTPNREVDYGERTVDEMMGGFVMNTVDKQALNLMVDGKTGEAIR